MPDERADAPPAPGPAPAPGWTRRTVHVDPFDVILEAPESPDDLVRDLAKRGDAERGYWAHLWSSSEVLARYVATTQLIGPGVRVLEIGCGLGLAGIVAALRGADVALTDREPDAAHAALRSAQLNGVGHRCVAAPFDWRHEPDPSWDPAILLAADVLYKLQSAQPVANLITKLGCVALISEPNRRQSADVVEHFERAGVRVWSTLVRGGRIMTLQAT